MAEETLKDKEWTRDLPSGMFEYIYFKKDVAEAVKKLKEKVSFYKMLSEHRESEMRMKDLKEDIDKIFGRME